VVTNTAAQAERIAAGVPDPELPMLTLADLGILRAVDYDASSGSVTVVITPTYSGCPAMREIGQDLTRRLAAAGFSEVRVRTELSPPWTTEWITAAGRRKLTAAGIAPPRPAARRPPGTPVPLSLAPRSSGVACPRCAGTETQESAAFGATACRALYRCLRCQEPFEYLKEI
jgi:ring-1,2-phenylacetyl-CoA epoxidase subunit PaaD